ncbi:unnamed protein product [Pedinophyceae sp. YPF-701]|nr:unnamed protein product [Pedinophyceae sp. YPF-701]
MVCVAASVVTKGGRALVSRQYTDMARVRIEGLLAAFPKLISSDKQHTFVETESVRYVYQPLEGMYLVLITTKQSNILEDIDTLRLLAKVVPDYAPALSEDAVTASAFDLIFAFDEVISMGHKENITAQQVKQNTDMDSHEEKLHRMIMQSKIQDTKEQMKKRAVEIDKQKIERRAAGAPGMAGVGPAAATPSPAYGAAGDAGAGGISLGIGLGPQSRASGGEPALGGGPATSRTGMSLKKGAGKTMLDSLRAEGEVLETGPARRAGAAAPAAHVAPASEPVTLALEERLSAVVANDGSVESVEIQGQLSLVVHADSAARVKVQMAGNAGAAGVQFKTHPNIDKQAYAAENALQLRDPNRPFPKGTPLGVLKWRYGGTDEAMLPVVVSCWPSQSPSGAVVTLEYESRGLVDLHNLTVSIPAHTDQQPVVAHADGETRWESRNGVLHWIVEHVDASNASGCMEVTLPGADPDGIYPIAVAFECRGIVSGVGVAAVVAGDTGEALKHSLTQVARVDSYEVRNAGGAGW